MNTRSLEYILENKYSLPKVTLYINQEVLPKSCLGKPKNNGISIVDSGPNIKVYTNGKRIDNDPEFLELISHYPKLIVKYEYADKGDCR